MNKQIETQIAAVQFDTGGMYCFAINSRKDSVDVALRRKTQNE